MATHYGPVPENLDDIADAFGISEEVLVTESIRAFVQSHLVSLEGELKALCAKYGAATVKELGELMRQGGVEGGNASEDYAEFDHLTCRIGQVKSLLEAMPKPPKCPPLTLDKIRDTLKAQLSRLAESYGVEVLGIYGPYATGEARPYDKVGLLVKLHKPLGLEFYGLEIELTQLLGVSVVMSTKDGMWPGHKERMLQELLPL